MSPDALIDRVREGIADTYRVERELARGVASHVYVAEDLRHERKVVIKVLEPDLANSIAAARFEQEIRISATLNHPNILPLLDSGRVDGLPFYVTPFVEGSTLRRRLEEEGQLELGEVVRITEEVSEALDYAHRLGVVHRDIKPENILLSSGHAVVADFGIAQAISRAGQDPLTRTGVSIGTPTYMSPEQAAGEGQLDARSDVYSLACVTYEMLTGSPPFTGRNVQAILARQISDTPSSVRIVRPDLPEGVDGAIGRALAKVPADRFRTADVFARALESGVQKRARRPLMPGLIAGGALIGLGLTGALLWTRSPELDPGAVVVFPLIVEDGADEVGEGVASLLGYVLDDTAPLRWIEGWHLLGPEYRASPDLLDAAHAGQLAAQAGAAHFITGRVVSSVDPQAVVLSLHDSRDGSVVERAGAAGTDASSVTGAAFDALGQLLLPLVEPGETVDPRLLSERDPSALANFYLGEAAYRRGNFERALGHYITALEQDTTLALAALRASETAIWLKDYHVARGVIPLAEGRPELLPDAYAPLADGIATLLAGEVDSALARLREHIAARPGSTVGWTLLGEALLHHFPATADPDREAQVAFRTALDLDPDFLPATYHLVELAAIRSELPVSPRYWSAGLRDEADPEIRQHLELMKACLEDADGPGWKAAVDSATGLSLLAVGYVLSTSPGQASCTHSALERAVGDTSAPLSVRYSALQVLGATLVGAGRAEEAHVRTAEASTWTDVAPYLHLLWDIAAEAPSDQGSSQATNMWTGGVDDLTAALKWLLGVWETKYGSTERAADLAERLAEAARAGRQPEALLAPALSAHVAAAEGNTEEALDLLSGLRVGVPFDGMQWAFWNALYPERVLRARLLREKGDEEGARSVLSGLAPEYPRTAVSAAFLPVIEDLEESGPR